MPPPRRGRSRPRPLRAAGAILLAGIAALLASCSGDPDPRGDRNTPPANAPTQGTIVYSDPKPILRGKRLAPVFLKVTTATEKEAARDTPMRLDAGTIEDDSSRKPSQKEVSREILQQVRERSGNVIDPERFALLWSQLEEANVFKLPRHRGGIPPDDRPSISITTGNRTWILLQPARNSESFKTQYEIWTNAKTIILLYSY